MNAPAETRAGISERVRGSAMGVQCPPPGRSTAGHRPRRVRALNEAADVVPARAASSARVRAGPLARPVAAAFAVAVFDVAAFGVAAPEPPRRRRPAPCGCAAGAGAGSTYGAAGPVSSVMAGEPGRTVGTVGRMPGRPARMRTPPGRAGGVVGTTRPP